MLDQLSSVSLLEPNQRHSWTALAAIIVSIALVGCSPSVLVARSTSEARPMTVDDTATGTITPTGPAGDWTLVFHDEFSGTELDKTKWIPCISAGWTADDKQKCPSWGGELQTYRPENVAVSDGAVHLIAQKEAADRYTSGSISTAEDAFDFNQPGYQPFGYRYGYLEVRIRTPDQPGMWPAVWSMPVGGGGKGEMDLYELLSGPDDPKRISMALHGDTTPEIVGQAHPIIPDIAQNFHVFGATWTPDSLTYWVDGKPIWKITEKIPQAAHFPMANLAIGGQVGLPDPDQKWPLIMDIDYMRVFQHR